MTGGQGATGAAAPSQAELLRAASRTFAIGIEQLPRALQRTVRISYLLLRVSDFLEDNEEMAPARKASLLELWSDVLTGARDVGALEGELVGVESKGPDALVAHNARSLVEGLHSLAPEERESVVRHVHRSTRGMAGWARRGPDFAGEPELDDYMHEVAGRVGWLLTDLFALHSRTVRRRAERMYPLAREFGLGLQMVNVIRGMPADRARGWIYVPESFTADLGVPRHRLFDRENEEAALVVLERLVAKAERHLEGAQRYVRMLPRSGHQVRVFCLLPLFFAIATLRISRGNPEIFRSECKIDRDEVRRIVRDTRIWGWSNLWVDRECARLRGEPQPVAGPRDGR